MRPLDVQFPDKRRVVILATAIPIRDTASRDRSAELSAFARGGAVRGAELAHRTDDRRPREQGGGLWQPGHVSVVSRGHVPVVVSWSHTH
eukprot:3191432-Rhodomonas_salina.1